MTRREAVFLDTETHRFAQGDMAPKLVCCSYRHDGKTGLLDHDQTEPWLKNVLTGAVEKRYLLIAHNAAYDFAVFAANYPHLRSLIFEAYVKNSVLCTQIREKLLDIADGRFRRYMNKDRVWIDKGVSLNNLTQWYLDLELDKSSDGWRLRYDELDGVPIEEWPEDARKYSIMDAEVLEEILREQEDRANRLQYVLPTQFDDTRASFALALASCWGLRIDAEQLRGVDIHITKRMGELRKLLHQCGLMRLKKNRDEKRIRELGDEAYSDLRIRFSKDLTKIRDLVERCLKDEAPKTEKGAVSTSSDTLELCDHPDLESLSEFSKLEKTQSTYLKRMYDGIDYSLHPRFNSIGAASGRTSSYDPNLQNQPRLPGVRECYIPRDGHVFIACDFDSQEMRTLAQTLVDLESVSTSQLAIRFQKDSKFDPHLEFAAGRLGLSIEEAHRRKKSGDKEIKKARQHAKIANFGLPGGMGIRGLVAYAKGYGVTLTEDEATELSDAWRNQWTEMTDYFQHVSQACGMGDDFTVEIPQTGFIRDGCSYTEACNTYFQSLAAHASKAALWETTRRCFVVRDSMLYGSRPVVFVHDEIIIECQEEWAHLAAKELEEVMVEQMHRFTPDIPPSASAAIMHRWSKNAEPVYKDDRLVAWDGQ